MDDDKAKIFQLKGYAGTGKTTMVKAICRYIGAQQSPFHLAAPTGRASLVLKQKTGYEAVTIHRMIYNYDRVYEQKEGRSFKFRFGLSENTGFVGTVYLIDEASMVSNVRLEEEFYIFGSGQVLHDLFEFIFDGPGKAKIVFIGDVAQLPPIGMDVSPALDSDYLRAEGVDLEHIHEAMLYAVMRQDASSGIIANATALRTALAEQVFDSFRFDTAYPDILEMDKIDLTAFYLKNIRDPLHGMVITHTNKMAQHYNTVLRKALFGVDEHPLQAGEWLLVVRNNYGTEKEIFNGELVRVVETGPIVRDDIIRYKGHDGLMVEKRLTFRTITMEKTVDDGSMVAFDVLLLENLLWSAIGKLLPSEQIALYVDFKMRMAKEGIYPKDAAFQEAIRSDPYFNAVQAKFGYAITCHKAQGGEWEHVFVDFQYALPKRNAGHFRWLYTAITRSNSKLYCINLKTVKPGVVFEWKPVEQLPQVLSKMYYAQQTAEDAFAFVQLRRHHIEQLAAQNGLKVSITPNQFMLNTVFSRDMEVVHCRLYYKKAGFSRDEVVSGHQTAAFAEVQAILKASLTPEQVPFVAKFNAQQLMHDKILAAIQEEEVTLTNIAQETWSVQYFFRTEAECAQLEIYFNKDNALTKATPRSTLGADDEQLVRLVEAIQYG